MFRTVPDFVIQFGIHGDPEVSKAKRACGVLHSCRSVDKSLEGDRRPLILSRFAAASCLVCFRSRRTGGSNASTMTPSLNRTSVDASRLPLLVCYCTHGRDAIFGWNTP